MSVDRLLVLLGLGFALTVCAQTAHPLAAPLQPSDPLHVWVGLKDPAGLERWVNWHIAEERKAVSALLAVTGTRTPENTLALYDNAQFELTLASQQTYVMFAVHPDKGVRDKAQALEQVIGAESVALSLNPKVYGALAAIDIHKADAATRHYAEHAMLEFRLGGVDKDEATRAKVRRLADQMTETGLKFGRAVQDDVRKVEVKNVTELDGLPADYIARHKPGPEGIITLTTDEPDMGPVMSYAKSSSLRREMFLAYTNRAFPANKPVLFDLLRIRQEMATILGFNTWADLATADQMMGSAANMKQFLDQVDGVARPRANREFKQIEAFAKAQDPSAAPLTQSDSVFWGERYRRVAYDFDSQSVRPYFPYSEVEAGILKTASRLFHIEFRPAEDAPVWYPAVHAYDVLDGGLTAGRIYLDMHPRTGKDKWFSESGLVPGQRGIRLPEATLICNFSGGIPGDPGLMQFDEVVTFFHEFGHMMHEVLGGQQRWSGQSGVSTEGDFVEAPSEMLEEVFHNPAILQSFGRHYQTGETLPSALIEKMNRASYFGRAGWVERQLMYSAFSLQVHDRPPAQVDLDTLEREDTVRFSPYQPVDGDHRYASFTHLTSYSSNYYTYVLDKVIALDFFEQFDPTNVLDGPAALRYRKAILEPGGSRPAVELVKDFLGRPQSIHALEHWMDREFAGPPSPAP